MQSENFSACHDKQEITAIKSQVAGPQKHHLPGVPEGIFFGKPMDLFSFFKAI